MSTKKKRLPPRASMPASTAGQAPSHAKLANNLVHIFVDDQNLFWGIVNSDRGKQYRLDFGRVLIEASTSTSTGPRGVKSAYIAGVIPEDDSFWEVAKAQGFVVRRGYLGTNNRSKQDDSYLITDMVTTLFEESGPSTIVLIAGDADYVPPLKKAVEKGWRVEVLFQREGLSRGLAAYCHEVRRLSPSDIELY
jgi:uncharacterized LabA/DUF88 family protein